MIRPEPSHARILIVDDEPANILLLERVLQRDGFVDIVATTDARECLTLFDDRRPDIVLLDLHMPALNGLAVMARLGRRAGAVDPVPVLILTADTTPEARQAALLAGAAGFLTKPIDPAEVADRVRTLLASPHVRA